MFASLKNMTGAGIGNGNNAGLRRQGLQPIGQTILCVLPVLRRGFLALIDNAAVFFFGDNLAERVFTLLGPAFAAGGG